MRSTFDTPGYDGTLNPVLPPGGWGVPPGVPRHATCTNTNHAVALQPLELSPHPNVAPHLEHPPSRRLGVREATIEALFYCATHPI